MVDEVSEKRISEKMDIISEFSGISRDVLDEEYKKKMAQYDDLITPETVVDVIGMDHKVNVSEIITKRKEEAMKKNDEKEEGGDASVDFDFSIPDLEPSDSDQGDAGIDFDFKFDDLSPESQGSKIQPPEPVRRVEEISHNAPPRQYVAPPQPAYNASPPPQYEQPRYYQPASPQYDQPRYPYPQPPQYDQPRYPYPQPPQPPQAVQSIVPAQQAVMMYYSRETMEMLKFQAEMFMESRALPKYIENVYQLVMVLQSGLELGMKPIQSIKAFYYVDGELTLRGKDALALVKRAGYQVEWKEMSNEESLQRATVRIIDPYGRAGPWETYSMEDAERAELLVSKKGNVKENWKRFPKNMLRWRAFGNAARFFCSHVTGGYYLTEEIRPEAFSGLENLSLESGIREHPFEDDQIEQGEEAQNEQPQPAKTKGKPATLPKKSVKKG